MRPAAVLCIFIAVQIRVSMCVCVRLSTYFDLSVGARGKQSGLRNVQGHGGDLSITMATVELLDLLSCVSQPEDHRGGRVAADYLQREFDPCYATAKALMHSLMMLT